MNESLMKHVERAVRPLRAGKRRKLQMREELLAHLTAIYDEELNQRHDEPAALAAATGRFGNPAELSRELERSLGWRDHWSWLSEQWAAVIDRTFSCQRGESFVRFAIRSAAWIAGLNAVLALLMIAVAWLFRDHFDPTFASFNRFTAVLFSTMAICELALLWAIHATLRALERIEGMRRYALTILNLGVWTTLFVVLSLAFWFGITLSAQQVLERSLRVTFFAVITVPGMLLLFAWASHWAIALNQPHERWTQLEVEE